MTYAKIQLNSHRTAINNCSEKYKLVLSRDAFIASRERIFLGTYPDTVLSQIVYFLFILGLCRSDQSREKWRQFWEFDNAWLVNHRDFFDSTHLPLFRLSFVSKKKLILFWSGRWWKSYNKKFNKFYSWKEQTKVR